MTLGIFPLDGARPLKIPAARWGIPTRDVMSAAKLGARLQSLFKKSRMPLGCIRGAIAASVVPSVDPILRQTRRRLFGAAPLLFVGPRLKTGVKILYDNPAEVGADRIVNAVAAYDRCRTSAIVVDFGTATTFDCVGKRGEYLGGVIAPGPRMSAESLAQKTAKLPEIKIFERPRRVIGKNTVASMSSGLFYGYVDLAAGLVRRLQKEMGGRPALFVTGGFARLMGPALPFRAVIAPDLTLEGLAILWGRNQRRKKS